MSMFLRQRLITFVAATRHTDLERLAALIEEEKVAPSVDRAYPLDQAPDAMRHLADGKVRAKVAITV